MVRKSLVGRLIPLLTRDFYLKNLLFVENNLRCPRINVRSRQSVSTQNEAKGLG